ncbi:MAG: hypothetical protein AAF747_10110 [Planctomycetota bacterium]
MRTTLTAAVFVCAGSTALAQSVLLNFTRTDAPDLAAYNELRPNDAGLADLTDTTGAATGIALTVANPFFDIGEASPLGSESPSGDAAIFVPEATDTFHFGHTGPFAGEESNPLSVVTFGGLDPTFTYDFTIFASRQIVNDLRETQYTLEGSNTLSGVLEPANNNTDVLRLIGASPDANGELSLSVEAGPANNNGLQFYYINALAIDIVPAPSTAALVLGAGVIAGRRRR